MEILNRHNKDLPKIKAVCFIAFLICGIGLSQTLENQIYEATEVLIAQNNDSAYNYLIAQEQQFLNRVKTPDEQLALVYLQCNKAYYLNSSNQLKPAISVYEAAWKRYNDHHLSTISDYDMIEYCLKPLGNLYTKTNNYTNAENTIQQYIDLAKKTNHKTHYIAGIINLSVLYQSRGLYGTVLELIAQVQNIPEISSSQREKLNNLKNFSTVALNRSTTSALTLPTNISDSVNLYAHYRLAYQMALVDKNYTEAFKQFNRSLEFRDNSLLTIRELAKSNVEEAQLHYVLNDFETANTLLENATVLLIPGHKPQNLPDPSSLYPENTLVDIFDLKARLQPDTNAALTYYDLSFYVTQLLDENLTSQESKLAILNANRRRSEWCIALLFDSFGNNPNPETFMRALNYAENDKAAILHDVYQKRSLLSKYPNDSLLHQEQGLLKKQERLTELLIKSQLGYETRENINLNKELLDVSIALKTVSEAIETKYGSTEKSDIDFEEISAKLKQDDAALHFYFYGNNDVYQFSIVSGEYKFLKIALTTAVKNSIANFINLFDNASIINNDVNNFTTQAHDIYQLLNLDISQNPSTLVIIPDGLLSFIPFEALLTQPTKTTTYSKMPFFVVSHNIVYNSNLRFYLEAQSKPNNPKILGVFPVFENSNQSLDYSIDEAHAIKNLPKTRLLMHADASKSNFLDLVSQYDILHLSTHAESGDFINPASIAFYDEPMLVNELYNMDIHPELVILSACETGVGKLHKGEGAMSIARGFQYAGAKNILYSLWQINDASTATLMAMFYDAYKKNHSASGANRQSKLDYLQDVSVNNIKKSPYYWSAFAYYGKIDKQKPNKLPIYYGIGLLSLIIGLLLRFRKQKSNAT